MATFRLLLLGTGGAGKTTLFKQFSSIYNESPGAEKRVAYVPTIHARVLAAMQDLISACDPSTLNEDAQAIMKIPVAEVPALITLDTASQIERLWLSEPIQEAYRKRIHLGYDESMSHFFENLDRITSSSYVPADDDIICLPKPSLVVEDFEFSADGFNFALVDVGGHRADRKKWPHCFEGVQGLMFVVSLADYDLTLAESTSKARRSLRFAKSPPVPAIPTSMTNGLLDALATFHDVCRAAPLRHSAIFLVFNKVDVFRAKLKTSALANTFPQFTGPNDFASSFEYIRSLFLGAVTRPVTVFCIQATMKSSVVEMAEQVLDMTMQNNLKNSGFM